MPSNDEKADLLFKANLGVTSTNKNIEFWGETGVTNKYILGENIFVDEIPSDPSWNGDVYNLNLPDLSENNIPDANAVKDISDIVVKITNLPLQFINNSDSDGTSGAWYSMDNSNNNILINAIQYNYKQRGIIQNYSYNLYNYDWDASGKLVTMGNGGWVFDVGGGVIKFYSTSKNPMDASQTITSQSNLSINFVKYIGKLGLKEFIPDKAKTAGEAGSALNGGSAADGGILTRFFENMTQQPRPFINPSHSSTTNAISISWQVDNSGGELDWLLARDGNPVQYIKNIIIEVKESSGNDWKEVTSLPAASDRSYEFELNTNVAEGITLHKGSKIDVRIWGENDAKEDGYWGGVVERALDISGLEFAVPGLPKKPTMVIESVGSNISIQFFCDDVDVSDNDTSHLSIIEYDISYVAIETKRSVNFDGSYNIFDSNISKDEKDLTPTLNQFQVEGGEVITLDAVHPGTRYAIQIRLKNSSNPDWSEYSDIYNSTFTDLPESNDLVDAVFTWNSNLSTITSGTTAIRINDPSTDPPASIDVPDAQYVNLETNSTTKLFTTNMVIFECTDAVVDVSTNDTLDLSGGALLATLDVDGPVSGNTDTIRFNKTIGGISSNNNFFHTMTVGDAHDDSEKGFRLKGSFGISDIYARDLSASSVAQVITYTLARNYYESEKVWSTGNIYVDNLSDPSGSFEQDLSYNDVTKTWNCGIPSIMSFNINVGNIKLTNINSQYKYLPSSTTNIGEVTFTLSPTTVLSPITDEELVVNDIAVDASGEYSWNIGDLRVNFKGRRVDDDTNIDVEAELKVGNLKKPILSSNVVTSSRTLPNWFCDYNSFDGDPAATTAPTFYEISDPSYSFVNLHDISFSLYSDHENSLKDWTPLFCDGSFCTTAVDGANKYYRDYSSFDDASGAANYKITSACDVSGNSHTDETPTGYKWIAFKAGNDEEAITAFYGTLQVKEGNGSFQQIAKKNQQKVLVYISHNGCLGIVAGVGGEIFSAGAPWWNGGKMATDPGQQLLSDWHPNSSRGVWEDDLVNANVLIDPDVSGLDAYLIVGLKNSEKLSLKLN